MQFKPPIPSPFPEPDPHCHAFRMAPLPLLVLSYGVAALVGIINLITLSLLNSVAVKVAVVGGGFAIETLCVLLCVSVLQTFVTPEGIRGQNAWGLTRTLRWEEIEAACPTKVLWLRYLKLSTPTRKNVIWVPLFLADMGGFCLTVAQFVPASHPLRQRLPAWVPASALVR